MTAKTPVLDVFIGRDGDTWRMCFAPTSWCGLLQMRMDERREIFPVKTPDPDGLARHMGETDSPYEHRKTTDGGIEILARGRSALTLLVWLEGLVRSAPGLAN